MLISRLVPEPSSSRFLLNAAFLETQGTIEQVKQALPLQRRPRVYSGVCSAARQDFIHIARITAANTPHTITNALMIWFSSETDIANSVRD
jgi:hypothetical protein